MNSSLHKFTILIAIVALCSALQPQKPSKSLPNFHKVNDRLYRGAQPKEAGIAELKSLGIRTVVDIGNGVEDSHDERRWVESSGMRYVNIHLHNWLKAKDSDIDAILKELDLQTNHPVFLHCRRGSDRTGTVVAIYRMKHDGWLPKQALDEAKKFGFGWWQFWMKDFINDYYRDHIRDTPQN